MVLSAPIWTVHGTIQQSYDAASATEMAEMRKIQENFAVSNFNGSFLGHLPAEVFNMVLERVMQQKDEYPVRSQLVPLFRKYPGKMKLTR